MGATTVTSLLEAGLITSTAKHNNPLREELIVHDIIRAKGNRLLDVQSLCEVADEQDK